MQQDSSQTYPTTITFFEFLTPSVYSGKKTITIRDKSESHYVVGSKVKVFTLETQKEICDIEILQVQPLLFDDISAFHAEQENMNLDELKALIKKVYPNTNELFVISFQRIMES